MFRTKPKTLNGVYRRNLTDLFKQCEVGHHVTYDEMSKLIGRNILDREYKYLMYQSKNQANKEIGAIFRNVRAVGFERLPNSEAHGLGTDTRRRVRRACNRAIRILSNAITKSNDMQPQAVRMAYAEITSMTFGSRILQDRYVPVLEETMSPPNMSDVVQSTIDALRVALRRTRK